MRNLDALLAIPLKAEAVGADHRSGVDEAPLAYSDTRVERDIGHEGGAGADADTLRAYVVAAPGFHTQFDKEGRLWVFKTGATELADYQAKGELAKHVVRPAAGPMGLTLKGPDATTLDEYQAQF